jgi:hypothetical protein
MRDAAIFAGITGVLKDGLGVSLADGIAGAFNGAINIFTSLFPGFTNQIASAMEPLQAYFNTAAAEMTEGGLAS